ncbi:PH domain-containing protein [Ureibacillus chungkukjangi]|uniref:YvbH-like protein n=1 Tax=Ureibacillus chungkukjangi TaxID=1202712 RepID=A0A318TQF6_9BACL|nr:PH domain-containing protein [Ureibacillus chungkukjangi]MCM3388602.1 PH domain-containing protein [Ureibacillus chungkukjangi]PYF06020.1 YvbH-like protein [Ureibacillus chungkukjangi]
MIKKFASDALGLSDIGKMFEPFDYDKTESDDYLLYEMGEHIYFLVKTKTDEYCFTNLALIHVYGDSAVSKKRTLKRYDYKFNTLRQVSFETIGTMDLDNEIKFTIGETAFNIEIHKKFSEKAKDLYKCLVTMERIMRENEKHRNYMFDSLEYATRSLASSGHGQASPSESFKSIAEFTNQWLQESSRNYTKEDYSDVFDLFIRN